MTESSQDENITLYTYAEIEEVKGTVGKQQGLAQHISILVQNQKIPS